MKIDNILQKFNFEIISWSISQDSIIKIVAKSSTITDFISLKSLIEQDYDLISINLDSEIEVQERLLGRINMPDINYQTEYLTLTIREKENQDLITGAL